MKKKSRTVGSSPKPPPLPFVPVVTDAQLAEMSPAMRGVVVAALARAAVERKRPGDPLK